MKRLTARLAVLTALAPLLFCLPSTQAAEVTLTDGVTLNIDSTVSAGLSIRTEDRDDGIIGRANGGTFNSVNYDNGNLNYVSAPLKLTQEMNMDLYDTKIFGRWTAFYDFEIMEGDTERTPLGDTAEDNLGFDIRLLDLFATHDFDVGGKLVQAKAGNIVLNWGETLFIQNGINEINPIRVPALRLAGAELREGLIPVTGVDLNFEVADGLSAEAFYLFEFDNTTIEPEGTFFSVNDFASPARPPSVLAPDSPPRSASESAAVPTATPTTKASSVSPCATSPRTAAAQREHRHSGLPCCRRFRLRCRVFPRIPRRPRHLWRQLQHRCRRNRRGRRIGVPRRSPAANRRSRTALRRIVADRPRLRQPGVQPRPARPSQLWRRDHRLPTLAATPSSPSPAFSRRRKPTASPTTSAGAIASSRAANTTTPSVR